MEGKGQSIILFNKLQPPEIKTKTLRRRRLLRMISKNLDKKVILLCAGAGYGKTTLLSHFLSENKIHAVYYHLERTDAEPGVFFSYLIAGIRRVNPAFGSKLQGLRHLFHFPQRYLEIIAGTFLNEIDENVRGDIYIILEDYHALQPSGLIDKILDYFFKHMPSNLHFIISSRSDPGISFTQMTARDEFLELGIEQLKFTKEEIRLLFEKMYSIHLKRRELEWVEKYSEGWPVSLRLMLQSTHYLEGIRSSDHTRIVIGNFLQSQASLFNYFAQEIFFQEGPSMRDFLLDCSVFEWLSPGLCAAVTGRRNTARLLSDLTKRNAFVVKIPEHGYRFHNLFRDFLYSKLTDDKRRKELCLRAGDYFAAQEKYDEALGLFARAKAYTKMISIMQKIGANFIAQGRSTILCNYIEQIPRSIINRTPVLLVTYAQALTLAGRLEDARRICIKAYGILRKKKRAAHQLANVLYALGGIHNTLGERASAMRYYRKASDVCPRSADLTRAAILNSLGSLHNMIGGKHLGDAIGHFEKALMIAQRGEYKDIQASILNNWAWSEWKMGNLNEAHAKLSEAIPILERNFSPGCGAGFFNAAQYSLLLGHSKQAKSLLDLGIQTCSPYNDLWSLATIWKGYAMYFRKIGDLKKAKQYAHKALQSYEKLGVDRLIVSALIEMCEIDIERRDYAGAEQSVSSIWLHKKSRDDADMISVYLVISKLKRAQGKTPQAEEMLLAARQLADRYGEVLQQFLADIELSSLYHHEGNESVSHEFLIRAIEMSRQKGYDNLLLAKLRHEKWMLEVVREKDIAQSYVMGIVKKGDTGIHWIYGNMFGVPQVKVDDCLIADEAWKTIKAKKLFFYVLCHKRERVSSDILVETLWPGTSYEKGNNNLRKAMQYIREATKPTLSEKDEIIHVVRGKYQISPNVFIDVDIDEFENLSRVAKSERNVDEKLRILQNAIDLYGNGFAVGWYDTWVEEMRLSYKRIYEECLSDLAHTYYDKAMYKEAASVSEKLISLNYLTEQHHHIYMRVLAHLGRFKDLEEDYRKLKKLLRKELKTDPQPGTSDLYNALLCRKSVNNY
jgi:LuxR family maltose regulon positive regulatory protein